MARNYRQSDYAKNKYSSNIVYAGSDETIEITLEQFLKENHGMTEEDFLETMDVVKKVGYDSAFTFIYSKRTGTPAASMENQIPADVVKDRFDRLLKEVQTIATDKAMALEGKVMNVLAEELNEQDASLITGRLDNNSVVHFQGNKDMIGQIYPVLLKECKGFYYLGEVVSNE